MRRVLIARLQQVAIHRGAQPMFTLERPSLKVLALVGRVDHSSQQLAVAGWVRICRRHQGRWHASVGSGSDAAHRPFRDAG